MATSKNKSIWLVVLSSGDPDDQQTINDSAFPSKKEADQACKKINDKLIELGLHSSSSDNVNWFTKLFAAGKQYAWVAPCFGGNASVQRVKYFP